MVSDDASVTVPSFFRCPISLDLMKYPVSTCTGVTYDRSSIQRWLDSGNNTCPATMQVLSSTDLVPNLTLQRLIDIWSLSLRLDSSDSPPSPPPSPPSDSPLSAENILSLARSITSSSSGAGIVDSLTKISRYCRESEENARFIARIDGFASHLLRLLHNAGAAAGRKNMESLELIVTMTEMVLSRADSCHSLISSARLVNPSMDSLQTFSLLVECGSVKSKIASVKIINLFATNSSEAKLVIAAEKGLLHRLLSLLSPETSQALLEAALSCLTSLSSPRSVKLTLVSLHSIIPKLSSLLGSANSTVPVIERSLELLETVLPCQEGRSALCEDPRCLELVLQRTWKVSSESTERAVAILWSVCYLAGEERAREAVARGNGLGKILVVMQSNCSPAVRQMARDLVKLLGSSNPRCLLSGYDTKTTHIMPF
ncbi:hypothetical protein SAY86_017390 [Trapa natans]|uniref:U-box domain-containing protein n=1 Tax=Trapa natans TaxID=22666 RepID=A0AAN7M529_TRANT|nr:hypothetical protein SAY86_017390 [Trapa natans]